MQRLATEKPHHCMPPSGRRHFRVAAMLCAGYTLPAASTHLAMAPSNPQPFIAGATG